MIYALFMLYGVVLVVVATGVAIAQAWCRR